MSRVEWQKYLPGSVACNCDVYELIVYNDGRWLCGCEGQLVFHGSALDLQAGKRAVLDALETHLKSMLQGIQACRASR